MGGDVQDAAGFRSPRRRIGRGPGWWDRAWVRATVGALLAGMAAAAVVLTGEPVGSALTGALLGGAMGFALTFSGDQAAPSDRAALTTANIFGTVGAAIGVYVGWTAGDRFPWWTGPAAVAAAAALGAVAGVEARRAIP